jgi:hypothetical protein
MRGGWKVRAWPVRLIANDSPLSKEEMKLA